METASGKSGQSVVYADEQLSVAVASTGTTQPSSKLTQVPGDARFTSLEDPWFLWLSQVLLLHIRCRPCLLGIPISRFLSVSVKSQIVLFYCPCLLSGSETGPGNHSS